MLYHSVNDEVIEASGREKRMKASSALINLNRVFSEIIECLKVLKVSVVNPRQGVKDYSFWNLYSGNVDMLDFENLFHSSELPIIKNDNSNMTTL